MKLVYLCTNLLIKKHNQEFYGYTFTTKYSFILRSSYTQYKLIVNKSGKSTDNFFGNNIDITAVMGKNGVGKSCLTDDIMQLVCRVRNPSCYFIAVFEEKQKGKEILKCFYNVNSFVNSEIDCFYCGTLSKGGSIEKYLSQVPIILRLGFSFDSGRWMNSFPEYHGDLSTCALVECKKETKESIRHYFINEIKNQINFAGSHKWNEAAKFCHPQYLKVETKISGNEIKQELKKIFGESKSLYEFYQSNIEFQKKFHIYLYMKSLLPKIKYKKIIKVPIGLKEMSTYLTKLIEHACKDNEEVREKSELFESYMDYIGVYWEERYEEDELQFLSYIPVEGERLQVFIEIFDKVKEEIFSYSWGLSSGEYQMFSIYSRLFSLTKQINKESNLEYVTNRDLIMNDGNGYQDNSNTNHDIILILDEADVALHPEWQQQYIKNLLQYLPGIFSDSYIQIILTTHSPIILSDIPNDHIIFISNRVSKRVIERRDEPLTFGANIQTLYYDSFSLKRGSIGEYALDYINKIVRVLKPNTDKDLHNPQFPDCEEIQIRLEEEGIVVEKKKLQKELENRIKVIGEPLIRRKLEEWLSACFPQKRELEGDYELEQVLLDLERNPDDLEKIKEKIRKKINYCK